MYFLNFIYIIYVINSVAQSITLSYGRLTEDYRIPTYDVISTDKY